MTSSRAKILHQLVQLTPLCSGSLHEQYLPCGKQNCRCHDKEHAQRHGPYYLWVRRIGGKQVNRTLRRGPELERVREGIANYHKVQELMGEILKEEESQVLGAKRGEGIERKKNFKWRLLKR
ncbi:MAG: DUF6788 family protein [Pyrinomonadaceae bacterium]